MRERLRCLFAVWLTMVSSGRIAQAALIQWPVIDGGNDHYYELVEESLNWNDARDAAAARTRFGVAGHLATITSAEEGAFITTNFATNHQWIGGFQFDKLAEPAGHWRWVTDETWSYTNWFAPQEPNESGAPEDWAAFGGSNHKDGSLPGQWQDWKFFGDPNDRPTGYFVEYDALAIPEPSTLGLLFIGLGSLAVNAKRRFASL